ncbi:MAG: helix-turn-helix transcriptional regulator [Eubacteriales bacterium]|nr:helix-turn-helix transcriptional regulator [Eubacteriales bacterium]
MILADKIIMLRKKNGWSQEQLAGELGVSRQSVSKWESGMSIPDLDKIIKMSGLFNVSTDFLLKDELEQESASETEWIDEAEGRIIDVEEANRYMDLVRSLSGKMAAAIALLILSPIPLVLMGVLAENGIIADEDRAGGIGMTGLLILVIIGVVMLIQYGMRLSQYDYLEKETIILSYGVDGVVGRRKQEHEPHFRTAIAAGVGLCIAGVMPIMIAKGLGLDDFVAGCMVCILLVLVAAGVYFIVGACMLQGSFQRLLQEGDYTPEEKKLSQSIGYFSGIYWCLMTAAYLGYSFWSNRWDRSWIIWPVAGVLFAALYTAVKAAAKKRLNAK